MHWLPEQLTLALPFLQLTAMPLLHEVDLFVKASLSSTAVKAGDRSAGAAAANAMPSVKMAQIVVATFIFGCD